MKLRLKSIPEMMVSWLPLMVVMIVIDGGDDEALHIQVVGEAYDAQKDMDGPIADIRDVLRQLEDYLDTIYDLDQTPETYISSEEDDGDEEEEKQ